MGNHRGSDGENYYKLLAEGRIDEKQALIRVFLL
jgi:hypothetical protein